MVNEVSECHYLKNLHYRIRDDLKLKETLLLYMVFVYHIYYENAVVDVFVFSERLFQVTIDQSLKTLSALYFKVHIIATSHTWWGYWSRTLTGKVIRIYSSRIIEYSLFTVHQNVLVFPWHLLCNEVSRLQDV